MLTFLAYRPRLFIERESCSASSCSLSKRNVVEDVSLKVRSLDMLLGILGLLLLNKRAKNLRNERHRWKYKYDAVFSGVLKHGHNGEA